jgi:uncharacterized membrane protein
MFLFRSWFSEYSGLFITKSKTRSFSWKYIFLFDIFKLKKIAPDYYDNLPCHNSWIKVLFDFISNPKLGPQSRIRRSIQSDALKAKATDLQNKSKVNEVLHDVTDNNNNNTHLSKEERKLIHKKKSSAKQNDLGLTNGDHSKNEW